MENIQFEMARRLVLNTSQTVYLTGKAGTGKTFFLKHICKEIKKNFVVVAPTGVAAINAGGTTIHSMFGLPTQSFLPTRQYVDPNLANNIPMLAKHFFYQPDKFRVLNELELLIIDEVSMVRADLLDAVDLSLRFTRKNDVPFGGVQLLLIGDLFQLPPVVKDTEWPLLKTYYETPFFFSAQVFSKLNPQRIELEKIHRQSDNTFISVLNHIRNAEINDSDLEALHMRYNPGFDTLTPGYITLTTHNAKADRINQQALENLDTPVITLDATVDGDFYENNYPTEKHLKVKKNAQIMFIKNDTSGERRYFNGKIGKLLGIASDGDIEVEIGRGEILKVQRETWENVKYNMDKESNSVQKNVAGKFVQFPIRLAWAITIHKSQGLTFEKAVIDAGSAFAAGQVYVALSRCTNLEGIVLLSKINRENIFSDANIVRFSAEKANLEALEIQVQNWEKEYALNAVLKVFQFQKLKSYLVYWEEEIQNLKSVDNFFIREYVKSSVKKISELQEVADKFCRQLRQLYTENYCTTPALIERTTKATAYFSNYLLEQMAKPLLENVATYKNADKMKKYCQKCNDLLLQFWFLTDKWQTLQLENGPLFIGDSPIYRESFVPQVMPKKVKQPKGHSEDLTILLYKEGKTVEEIMAERQLAATTFESHLAKGVLKGEVPIQDFFSEIELEHLNAVLGEKEFLSLGDMKEKTGDAFSWGQLRMFQQHCIRELQLKEKSLA